MINKITLRNKVKIIDNEYVIKVKENNVSKIYEYLIGRSFDNFPKILRETDKEIYYEYLKDIDEPNEQKMIDLILLLSILHNKTVYYKEMDLEYYKYIYEEIIKEIDDIYNYYNNIMDIIDNEVYMSPANYLIARNISIIYSSLNIAKEYINKWYKEIDGKRDVRVVMCHNNIKIDHYVKSDKDYLISWDKAKIDMPIYDIINLYKGNYLDYDFIDLLDIYFRKFSFTNDEMLLFLSLIIIPDKIINNKSEYIRVSNVRKVIDYLYKTKDILEKYGIKEETNKA